MARKEKLTKTMGQLRTFLRKQGWAFIRDGDVFRGIASNDSLRWTWSAAELGDGRFLGLSYGCTVDVPESRRAAAAEYITRANYGLCFGAFEMAWETGAVYFRTSVPIDMATGVAGDALEHLVYLGHCMMSRYMAGLLAVAIAGVNPAQAVATAEQDRETAVGPLPVEPPADLPQYGGRFTNAN